MIVPFSFKRLEIPDVVLIQPRVFEDARGFFMETYQQREFEKFGIAQLFVQDNHSRSKRGVLRGLHYQKDPMAQGKLVRCTRGAVFDVAVDLRRGSPTYGKGVGRILSEESKLILWIPRGFAHGYTALEDNTEVFYKTDNLYSVQHERGIIWSDPEIGIQWPITSPIVSDKDATYPKLSEADHNFAYGVK